MKIISGEQALVELSKHKTVFYKDGSGIWCVVDNCTIDYDDEYFEDGETVLVMYV